jgi:hypothetical protein
VRFSVDGVVFDHDSRRRHNDRTADYDRLGNDGSRLLDPDRRRSRILV